jgi:hypothetical protein
MISIGIKTRVSTIRWIALLAALALTGLPAWAQSSQQGSSSQADSQTSQSTGNGQNPVNGNPAETNPPPNDEAPVPGLISVAPPETQINQLGTANPLSAIGRYHWGPLFLGSTDVRGAVDIISPTNVAVDGPAQTNVLTLFETSVFLDKTFGRNRFTLQYDPRVAVTNSQVAYDYLNQNVGINTYYVLSPRWTLGLSDRFLATRNSGLAGGVFADSNTVTSTTLQSDFLDNSQTFMTNIASASFSYGVSPRTLLSFAPNIVYQRTSGLTAAEGGDISALNFALEARVRHLISARTSIGAYASTSFVQFTGLLPTSTYYTFGLSASRQLTATTGVSLELGATESVFQARQKYWGASGSVAFFKVFPRGRVSVIYTRGLPASGYVTNYLAQRVDVIGYYMLSRRLTLNAGFGYEGQESNPQVVSGKYVSGELDYILGPTWSVFGTYAYKLQDSNDPQVFAGSRNFGSAGLRWTPNSGQR